MKYRCRMCGYEGEGDMLPSTPCPSCGMDGEWEANPFDAHCAKCGQGYYESEKPNFCPGCGERIGAPAPKVVVTPIRQAAGGSESASSVRGSSASSASTTPTPTRTRRSINWHWLKPAFKVLALAGVAYAVWFFRYEIAYRWYIVCEHWFVSAFVSWGIGWLLVKIMQQINSRRTLWRCVRWIDWDREWLIQVWNSRYGIGIIFFVEILIWMLGCMTICISLLILYLLFWWGSETGNKIKERPILTCCCVLGFVKIAQLIISAKLA